MYGPITEVTNVPRFLVANCPIEKLAGAYHGPQFLYGISNLRYCSYTAKSSVPQ